MCGMMYCGCCIVTWLVLNYLLKSSHAWFQGSYMHGLRKLNMSGFLVVSSKFCAIIENYS